MKLRVLLVAMCVGLLVVPTAYAEVSPTLSLAGDVETNTTLYGDDVENTAGESVSGILFDQDGRVRLTITGLIESDSGFFAGAKADSMIGTSGIASVDDAWLNFGKGIFDFKIGRYEYESLYGKGNDILIVTPKNIPGVYYNGRYEGNYARGRFSSGIDNLGLTWNGESNFFQLGLVYGGISQTGPILITTTDPDTGTPIQTIVELPFGVNAFGFRPVYKYQGGAFTFRVGFDYLTYFPQDDKLDVENVGFVNNDFQANFMGAAGDLEFQFGEASSAGLSLAYGAESGKTVDNQDQDETGQFSMFAWVTMGMREADELGLGFGYQNQTTEYKFSRITEDASGINWEGYLSYIQQLPVESLKAKYAFSYASTTADPGGSASTFTSNRWGFRVRFNYDF